MFWLRKVLDRFWGIKRLPPVLFPDHFARSEVAKLREELDKLKRELEEMKREKVAHRPPGDGSAIAD
jgi:hypothetical protein